MRKTAGPYRLICGSAFLCNRNVRNSLLHKKRINVLKMRTRAKMQIAARDRARRENVPGTFFFYNGSSKCAGRIFCVFDRRS